MFNKIIWIHNDVPLAERETKERESGKNTLNWVTREYQELSYLPTPPNTVTL